MYCSHCGKALDTTARFCPACGATVQAAGSPPPGYGRVPVPGQLTRPRHLRMIGGVCAGLSLHYGWDLSFVRIVCVLLVLFTGVGIVAYIIAWVVIPEEPYLLPQGNTGSSV